MKLHDQISTAFGNLGRRKARTALTSTGVVVGTLTIVVMVSLGLGVRRQINAQFERIGLDRVSVRPVTAQVEEGGFGNFGAFGFEERTKLITDADLARWRKWPGVARVTGEVSLPFTVRAGLRVGKSGQSVAVASGDAAPLPFLPPATLVAGTLDLPPRGGIVLSQKAARRAQGKTDDSKPLSSARAAPSPTPTKLENDKYLPLLGRKAEVILRTSRGESKTFTLQIVGVSSSDQSAVRVSPADSIAMKSWWFNEPNLIKTEGYDSATVRAVDVAASSEVARRLRGEKFEVQSLEAVLEAANRIFTVITLMLGMVGGVALLVASIGIANTMVMAIYERTREIGTLKAMGASRSEIRRMFMLEAGFIGLLGGAVGLFLGWALGRALDRGIVWYAKSRQVPVAGDFFVVTWELALASLAFAALIGIVAGLLPAQRAAKLDPLEALRHE